MGTVYPGLPYLQNGYLTTFESLTSKNIPVIPLIDFLTLRTHINIIDSFLEYF